MSGTTAITPSVTFGGQVGSIALSLLDTNFTQVATFLNNANNYSNYLVDTGAANSIVVTTPTSVTATYTAGLLLAVKVIAANTGASTINVNSLGAKNILNPDGSALTNNQMPANSIVALIYDGTQFLLAGGSPSSINIAGGTKGQVPVQSAVGTTTFMDSSFAFKNRIINGAMVIDQRNAGSQYTTPTTNSGTYTLDRYGYYVTQASKFTIQQNAGSVTPPAGFTNYLGITSTSSYSVTSSDIFIVYQKIEGFNVADLGWGTVNAKAVTLSFQVYSSLTGTFGGSIASNNTVNAYLFSYSIPSANTWTTISVTIPGPTSGTWLTNNGWGLEVAFGLGAGSTYTNTAGSWLNGVYTQPTGTVSVVGTSGATFYITGVQLEKGSTATSFDYRPYGTELALCKRYYDKSFAINTAPAQNAGRSGALESIAIRTSGNGLSSYFRFSVPMRTTPTTVTFYNPSAANGQARNLDRAADCTGTSTDNVNEIGGKILYGLPVGTVLTDLVSVHFSADAEL